MSAIWIIFLYLVLILLLASIFKWILEYVYLRIKLSSIPGPDTFTLIKLAWKMRYTHIEDLFEDLIYTFQQYKNGLVIAWLGTEPMLLLQKPHQLEVIMRSRTLITKGDLHNYMSSLFKNGLLTSTGDVWHRNRRLITPAFHFKILDDYTALIVKEVDVLNEYLNRVTRDDPGKMINIYPIILEFMLEIILKTMMGFNTYENLQPTKSEFVTAAHDFSTLTLFRFICLPYRSDFIFYRTKKGKEYVKALKTLHAFSTWLINKKREINKTKKEQKVELETDTDGKPKAFLDLLIDAGEAEENPLTFEEIRQQVDTFIAAAFDTTGIALTYTLFCLGNAPATQKNILKEINEVFEDHNEPSTNEKLSQLKLLERVIKESLRLFPSAPSINRKLDHDVLIDGYTIPKGIVVNLQIFMLHRDPDIWENPSKFNPDRFLPENSQGRHPYAYIPFSAGPRNCLGQKFAMMMLKIALVGILRKWTITSDVKIEDVKLSAGLTLVPPNKTINLKLKSNKNTDCTER